MPDSPVNTRQLCDIHHLSDESIGQVMQYAQRLTFARKEVVIEEGCRDTYAYFVEQGAVRTFVMREGKYVILSFAFEGYAVSSILGIIESRTSHCTIETLEPTTLLRIPRKRLEELFMQNIELANWGRKLAEWQQMLNEAYFANYSWMDKGQQYKRMLREYPQLLQRIPLKDLAAYLAVTPQSLSRIRAKIK